MVKSFKFNKTGKIFFSVFVMAVIAMMPLVSQVSDFDTDSVNVMRSSSAETSGIWADALNAYRNGDWKTSIFLFKKLHVNHSDITPESLYMLIMAQTYDGQYKQAVAACDQFLARFPHSQYSELVIYQKGKNLYHTGDYEKSILTLSDFCHTYPKHSLYSASLFWIAESFYATYNFDNAKPLYERVVTEYPDDSKAKDSQFRLDIIAQRSREEKLLYLLKQTGEDYLSSKETYEKALKYSQFEKSVGENSQIRELRQQNEVLDTDLANEKRRNAELEEQLKIYQSDISRSIKELKEQASSALKLLDEQEDQR